MPKLVLTDLTSLANQSSALQTMSENNAAIVAAIENTLSLDGTTPNSMQEDLDMDENKVINVADPVDGLDAVNLRSMEGYVEGAVSEIITEQYVTEIVTTVVNEVLSDAITDELAELTERVEVLENGVSARQQCFVLCLSDTETPIEVTTKAGRFYVPYNFVPIDVKIDLGTAQTSGSVVSVDCLMDGVSILLADVTIANGSKASSTGTIDTTNLEGSAETGGFYIPAGSEITFDITQVGDGTAVWLQATLQGYLHIPVGGE